MKAYKTNLVDSQVPDFQFYSPYDNLLLQLPGHYESLKAKEEE